MKKKTETTPPRDPPTSAAAQARPVASGAEPESALDAASPAGAVETATDVVGALESERAALEAQLATLAAQLAQQHDTYLRLAAEYDNFRKRATRDRQKAELEGMGLLVRGILDALDDLGRFAHVDPGATDAHTLQEGVELVERKLLKSLATRGLEVVDPAGQPFDPAVHEAVMTAPAASADEDHLVSQVFQVGYLFNGQLLRAAKVVVKQWSGPGENADDAGSRADAGPGA